MADMTDDEPGAGLCPTCSQWGGRLDDLLKTGHHPECPLRQPSDTDGASPRQVLAELCRCASLWEPDARLLGNIRAADIVRAVKHFIGD